ncbi:MAG TPA: hypothetical protein VII49_11350 [Rhizomicrobium sp.]
MPRIVRRTEMEIDQMSTVGIAGAAPAWQIETFCGSPSPETPRRRAGRGTPSCRNGYDI